MQNKDQTLAKDAGVKHASILPYIVAATFFMEYLDTTVIATALPQMAKSFSVGPNEVSLGMTAYMLTLAVFIPISGWIADRFGSRTVFAAALVIFTLASVLCGSSSSLGFFTFARILQGIGGAMMVPVGRMIVVRNTENAKLMKAIATITWPGIIAPVIGPSVGGFITTYASWHWVFLMNIPFGIAAFAAVCAYVPNQYGEKKRRLDIPGFLLSGAALICLLYGTELASHEGTPVIHALAFMLAGVILGVAAVRYLKRVQDPLLDISALRVPTYSVTVLWGAATRIGIEAVPYLCPLLFQIGYGYSPFQSGLLLLATAVGNIGMKLFTTHLFRRYGFRTVALVNVCIASVLMLTLGLLDISTPLFILIVVLFGYGLARSLQFSLLATLAYADVPPAQKGPASTLWSVAQQMTIGMGIAFGALCLRVADAIHQPAAGAGLAHFDLADFRWAFAAAALLTLASIVGYLRLARDAGSAIGGGSLRPRVRA
ncbi:MFS transporter [Bordetella sp. N]|uniref:MFS transporter n=1 Tax=Bordetella sp. N TaxID=1746199 RepID=UPI00070B3BAB|nr:MFS transporter [Bordetella sp. N]ALM83479.1 MFS transporter [Bordetella sp. N]